MWSRSPTLGSRALVFAVVLTASVTLRLPGASAASKKVSIAILNLDDRGAGPDMAANMSAVIANELSRLTILQVISSRDIANLLSVEAQRQMLGCNDASCLTDLTGSLGADYLITGNVGKVGTAYLITLQLINQTHPKVEAREEVRASGALEVLIDQVQVAARKLIRPIMASRQGALLLTSNQEGANVFIDDKLVGVTPVRKLDVTWGPHTVRVERTGFIAFARDIDIDSDAALPIDVSLIPSAEFIRSYESRNKTIRALAWTTAALAVVGAAAALACELDGRSAEQTFDQQLTNLQSQGLITVSGSSYRYKTAQDQSSNEPALQALRDQGNRDTLISRVTLGVGAAAAVASVVLFVVGEDPGRYQKYKGLQTATVQPQISPGNLAVAVAF